jgi:hypothetical protein
MWKPKQQNCDEYIGKMARIYHTRDDSYEQGILLHIVKTFDKKKRYCVTILLDNKYTKVTYVSDVIKDVHVKNYENEIQHLMEKICKVHIVEDMRHELYEYIEPFIAI